MAQSLAGGAGQENVSATPTGTDHALIGCGRPPVRRPADTTGSWQNAEEARLAFILIHTWTLATGRTLRSDVPPAQLSEDELIAFWADDHITHHRQSSPPTASAHKQAGGERHAHHSG